MDLDDEQEEDDMEDSKEGVDSWRRQLHEQEEEDGKEQGDSRQRHCYGCRLQCHERDKNSDDEQQDSEDGREEDVKEQGDSCRHHRYERSLQQAQPPQGWQKSEQLELWVAYFFGILNTRVCLTVRP